jgi:hypothetical protein
MFNWLKPNPKNQLQKHYDTLVKKAFTAQREGDIRTYSLLTAEAVEVKKKLDALDQ